MVIRYPSPKIQDIKNDMEPNEIVAFLVVGSGTTRTNDYVTFNKSTIFRYVDDNTVIANHLIDATTPMSEHYKTKEYEQIMLTYRIIKDNDAIKILHMAEEAGQTFSLDSNNDLLHKHRLCPMVCNSMGRR